MSINKHLSFDDRLEIERGLKNNESFKMIAERINKNCTTISREIRNHRVFEKTGAQGRIYNNCIFQELCKERHNYCIRDCSKYKGYECSKLSKPPYVCNGCENRTKCTLTKALYKSGYADTEYRENLVESRKGVLTSEKELENLDNVLKPIIKDRGQSIHQAVINNKNKIMFSEKTIYNYIDMGLLSVRNIDLPRKVRFRERRKSVTTYKIDKNCLNGRKYEDYQNYMIENPDTSVVQMDSVEGIKGGKVLLTLHFVNCSFMLAFIREQNDAQSVIDIFNYIQDNIGIEKFKELFDLILTDNGSEFSNPSEIEIDMNTGEKRTQIFYCHPSRPDQKGACEVNHEFIRRILPKGTSFDELNQNDINLMMSHINSYKRKKLNNVSPLTMFSTIYGQEVLDKLGLIEIKPNEVNLSKSLLKK